MKNFILKLKGIRLRDLPYKAKKFVRKLIVRTCVLNYRIGKKIGGPPRISMMFTALFAMVVTVNVACDTLQTFTWYNGIFIGILVLLVWSGFDWFGAGYFAIWPVRFDELDDFQKYTFSRVNFHELTEEQAEEVVKIINEHSDWF
jgi:hypothetical protein